jgi:trans-2,3-dihydro-3-hydroxyanthranilate isomerase
MRRAFHTLDVFTQARFAGNPLAVVRDAQGLTDARMQAIAREFNLSETVFVLPPRDPINTARIRIFTPRSELPFAGHPTIGAAILIAELDAPEMLGMQHLSIVLEEKVGDIACTVRKKDGATLAHFALPRLPEKIGGAADVGAIAAAVGLEPSDIGFEGHAPSLYSAGVGFTFIPVGTQGAIARARPALDKWDAIGPPDHPNAFLYTREVETKGSAFHARMFAPMLGIAEDPATGSAAAAFAGVLMQYDELRDGDHGFVIEQGFEMGRPSFITLAMEVRDGALTGATIGGAAVRVSEGFIEA